MTDDSITQIRTALATAIANVSGLRVYPVIPGVINPPVAVVRRSRTDIGTEFNGGDTSTFVVGLYLSATDVGASQSAMDAYLSRAGSSSVVAALRADSTLGGACRSLTVSTVEEYGLTELSGVQYLAAIIPVIIKHE